MRVIQRVVALVVLYPLLGCVAVNSLVNARQGAELDQLRGSLFVVNCRYIASLPEAKLIVAREGADVQIDLRGADADESLGSLSRPRYYLIPSYPEWSPLRRQATGRRKSERLAWRCAARLCRRGFSEPESSLVEFSAVPDGSYDFFLFFKDLDIDEYGLSSGAIWATLHNTVTVLDGQAILQGLFQEVPEDRKGLVELPDLL